MLTSVRQALDEPWHWVLRPCAYALSGSIVTDAGARELEAQSEGAAVPSDANVQLSLLDAGPEGGPIEIARRFMDAIRHKRQEVLLSLATLPFQLRDSGAAVSCKGGGSVAQRAELAKLLSRLLTDDLLAEELQRTLSPRRRSCARAIYRLGRTAFAKVSRRGARR
jgi:hypothetical protein